MLVAVAGRWWPISGAIADATCWRLLYKLFSILFNLQGVGERSGEGYNAETRKGNGEVLGQDGRDLQDRGEGDAKRAVSVAVWPSFDFGTA